MVGKKIVKDVLWPVDMAKSHAIEHHFIGNKRAINVHIIILGR